MVDHDMGAIRGIPKDLIDASRQILENEPIETGKNINPAGIHFPEPEKEEEELVEGPEKHKTGDKESYRDFVNKALKKFGVNSPAELSADKKKKKIKPEKVNTNPSMDGQEQSKRPLLVRER